MRWKRLGIEGLRLFWEAPEAPACAVPLRSPSAPVMSAREVDVSPVAGLDQLPKPCGDWDVAGIGSAPAIHAWRSSPQIAGLPPRGQRETWRRRSDPETGEETPSCDPIEPLGTVKLPAS